MIKRGRRRVSIVHKYIRTIDDNDNLKSTRSIIASDITYVHSVPFFSNSGTILAHERSLIVVRNAKWHHDKSNPKREMIEMTKTSQESVKKSTSLPLLPSGGWKRGAMATILFVTGVIGLMSTTSIPEDVDTENIKGPHSKIKIACVGDSLTLGEMGGPRHEGKDYPSQLQGILGENYTIENFGRNGATAFAGIPPSYNQTEEFRTSLEFRAGIYLLMLGTNDSQFWESKGGSIQFERDLGSIIDSILSTQRHRPPRIILATNPWIVKYKRMNQILINDVFPAIKRVAKDRSLQVVDMYSVTVGQEESYIGDGLHLNVLGYEQLANAWKSAILCNGNGICEIGEDCHSCPRDCSNDC